LDRNDAMIHELQSMLREGAAAREKAEMTVRELQDLRSAVGRERADREQHEAEQRLRLESEMRKELEIKLLGDIRQQVDSHPAQPVRSPNPLGRAEAELMGDRMPDSHLREATALPDLPSGIDTRLLAQVREELRQELEGDLLAALKEKISSVFQLQSTVGSRQIAALVQAVEHGTPSEKHLPAVAETSPVDVRRHGNDGTEWMTERSIAVMIREIERRLHEEKIFDPMVIAPNLPRAEAASLLKMLETPLLRMS
jgi:hypothetical protein